MAAGLRAGRFFVPGGLDASRVRVMLPGMDEIEAGTLSTREASRLLGVSRQRLDQLRDEGRLTASKDANGKLRWNAAEVARRAAKRMARRRA